MQKDRFAEALEDYEENHYIEIKTIYNYAHTTMLLAWQALHLSQHELEKAGAITTEEKMIDAQADYDGKILKITVNSVLPRKCNKTSMSLMRYYWDSNIMDALRLLEPVHFEHALCAIKVYVPREVGWDVDNRAVSIIINALRGAKVVRGDEWDKLSLVLLGGFDRKHPRTEIRLIEFPGEAINSLFGSM
jgi:hypothetical protein